MKLKQKIKSAATFLHFTSFIMICLMSCNFVLENKKGLHNNSFIQKTILTNKNEAKLLVKASQDNLDIIKLCQLIEETEPEKNIKNLTKDIESTHLEIFKNYKEAAQENLISIPNYSNIESQIPNENLEKDKVIEDNLQIISNKINNQIELLTKLSKTTDNIELKELSEKTNIVLNLKLDKTENIISKL